MPKSILRIDNLTGLRGFAALWVVIYHFGPHMGSVVSSGYLGVDVFFVLSGLVLSLVYVSSLPESFTWAWYRKFLSRRFAKIYPLHLVTFVMMVAAVYVAGRIHYHFVAGAENTFWSALCNILLLHSMGLTHLPSWNGPSWSVSAEWFAYVVMFAPMAFILRRTRIRYVACAAFALWMSFLALCNYVLHSNIGIAPNGVLRIIPEFFCGYLLYRVVARFIVRFGDLFTAVGVVTVCIVSSGGDKLIALLMPGVMLILAGLYAGGKATDRVFGNRLSVLLGEASYSIYLCQLFIEIAVHQFERRSSISGLEHGAWGVTVHNVVALISTASVAFCGVQVHRYFEEPTRRGILRALSAERPEVPEQAQRNGLPIVHDSEIVEGNQSGVLCESVFPVTPK